MKIIILICASFLLSVFGLYSQSAWYKVPGAPNPRRIDDVSFVNDSVGWLVANTTVFKTSDKGETWDSISSFPPNDYVRSIEFINDQVGFIGTLNYQRERILFKTIDGGKTFIKIDSLLPFYPLRGICGIAHLNNLVIAVGSVYDDAAVYKSADAGQSWSLIKLDAFANALIDVFIIDSLTYLVSGQSDSATGIKAVILKTTDGGITWNRVALSTLTNSYCWKLFIRPNGIGLASIEDYDSASVFKTMDYGNTWNQINIINPFPGVLGALGGIGLLNDTLGWTGRQYTAGYYETSDGGLTWTQVNFGSNINRMVALDSITMLAVGRTVYKYGSGAVGISAPEMEPKDAHELKIYPNPASDKLRITLKLNSNTTVVLNLIDGKGNKIKKIEHSFHSPGEYEWTVDLHAFKNGNYMIQLLTNEQNFGKKFQLLH